MGTFENYEIHPLLGVCPIKKVPAPPSYHWEALFLPTGKLPPLLSGSCITSHSEASSLIKLIQAVFIGDLLDQSFIIDPFFF